MLNVLKCIITETKYFNQKLWLNAEIKSSSQVLSLLIDLLHIVSAKILEKELLA